LCVLLANLSNTKSNLDGLHPFLLVLVVEHRGFTAKHTFQWEFVGVLIGLIESPEERSRPISRVLSRTVIHLAMRHRIAQATYPGTDADSIVCKALAKQKFPYLVLLRVGFTVPSHVTTDAVRSYRTISPLPALQQKSA